MRKLVLSVSLLVGASTAWSPRIHRALERRQYEPEPSSFDEACNIGYCSVMGATIGGWGGNYTTVSTLEQFARAASDPRPDVIIINGGLSGQESIITVGSSKTIIGAPGSSLSGIQLHLNQSRNVILRNLRITNVLDNTITIERSSHVWVDHCDLSSTGPYDQQGQYYNGLLSIIRGSDFLTVTATLFQGHPQAVLVGDSDTNSAEDKGRLRVTFARNHFRSLGNAISFRFATSHVFNSYFDDAANGINAGTGAQVLVEASVFRGRGRAVFSEGGIEPGYATVRDVDLGDSSNTAQPGNLTAESVLYPYDWYMWEAARVQEFVVREAGQRLRFFQMS